MQTSDRVSSQKGERGGQSGPWGRRIRIGAVAALLMMAFEIGPALADGIASSAAPTLRVVTPPERGASGAADVEQIVPTADGHGYWMTSSGGAVAPFGDAVSYGSAPTLAPGSHIVGMAATPRSKGYWEVGSDGGIFSFGDAAFFGSTGSLRLNRPIVGMASTPDGKGYWLVASDGGIFAFGDAAFFGSTGALHLNKPIVGMASTWDGKGYWLVASDGGIFAFGDAVFHGSTGSLVLNQPVVGMAVTPGGAGYWLVASDGGIFAFGNARFKGSMGGSTLNAPVVSMAPTSDGGGYWMVGNDGGIFAFGDAPFYGSLVAPATGSTAGAGSAATADPVASLPPTPDFLPVCYPHNTSALCTGDILLATAAARGLEGMGPMHLPGNFNSLTSAEQLFVLTDTERVDRGLPPFVGLDPTLSADAKIGAVDNTDPGPTSVPPGMSVVAWGANWGENGNPLGSNYFWMYDDGLNSGNVACTATDSSGCWGHRHNILGLSQYQSEYGGTLLMGAAEDDSGSHGGWASDAEVLVLATGPVPPQIYTWADAVAAGAS